VFYYVKDRQRGIEVISPQMPMIENLFTRAVYLFQKKAANKDTPVLESPSPSRGRLSVASTSESSIGSAMRRAARRASSIYENSARLEIHRNAREEEASKYVPSARNRRVSGVGISRLSEQEMM
jgi:hypothetical protein